MKTKRINRWLTLGANFGVLIGILLLVAELNQNSLLMQAQLFNDRSSQGTDLFMAMAVSGQLAEIDAQLHESGFPEDPSAISELTAVQRRQLYWFMRANRFRIENLLYQQTIGLMEYDPGPVSTGRRLLKAYEALGDYLENTNLERLIEEVEKKQN